MAHGIQICCVALNQCISLPFYGTYGVADIATGPSILYFFYLSVKLGYLSLNIFHKPNEVFCFREKSVVVFVLLTQAQVFDRKLILVNSIKIN